MGSKLRFPSKSQFPPQPLPFLSFLRPLTSVLCSIMYTGTTADTSDSRGVVSTGRCHFFAAASGLMVHWGCVCWRRAPFFPTALSLSARRSPPSPPLFTVCGGTAETTCAVSRRVFSRPPPLPNTVVGVVGAGEKHLSPPSATVVRGGVRAMQCVRVQKSIVCPPLPLFLPTPPTTVCFGLNRD
jgi:hypothetical protein